MRNNYDFKKLMFRSAVLIAIIVFSLGCHNKRKNFTYFKEDILIDPAAKLRLNGIYNIVNYKDRHPMHFFIFYSNGMCLTNNTYKLSVDFWANPDSLINEYYEGLEIPLTGLSSASGDSWGHYQIKDDSIFIQSFMKFYDSTVNRDVYELKGYIRNDSTIHILEQLCDWRDYNPSRSLKYISKGKLQYIPSAEYRFYQTTKKPDSTYAWFFDKNWYNEGLHLSRKYK